MPAEVQNCPLRNDGRCPDDWEAMTPTTDRRVRQCQACGRQVFLCRNRDEALFFARHGWRVALAPETRVEPGTGSTGPGWAAGMAGCFDRHSLAWGGDPAARWQARELLRAAIAAGATMANIQAAARTFLQGREVPADHMQAQLEKIRNLVF